jgi:hypothetical protein
MKHTQSSSWIFRLLLSGLGLLLMQCGDTSFRSGKEPKAKLNGTPNTGSAAGSEGYSKDSRGGFESVSGAESGTCENTYKPNRIAFVIDNTGSNSCTSGRIQDISKGVVCDNGRNLGQNTWGGTDPIRPNNPFDQYDPGAGYTERQRAVFETVLQIIERDKNAIAKDPTFLGTDVGISSFPRSQQDPAFQLHTGGNPMFPKPMYNMKNTQADESFKSGLWNLLKFTHSPSGMTPYVSALQAAQKLILDEKVPGDVRPGIVIFITDGLPTDLVPDEIVQQRAKVGSDTKVVIFSIYRPGVNRNPEEQNKDAKSSLLRMWNDDNRKSPGFPDFESYWKRLLSIPKEKEVSDSYYDIEDAAKLNLAIKSILTTLTSCK